MKLIFKLIFFLVIFFFNFSDDEAIALCSDVDPNDSPLTISCDTSGGNLTIDSFDATLSNGQTLAITNEDDGHIIIDNGGNFSYDGKNSITSTSGTVTVLLEGKGNGGFYFYEDLNFSGSLQISDALARVGQGMTSNIDVDIGSGATLYIPYDSATVNIGSLTGSGILSNYHRSTLNITNSGNNSFSGSLNQNASVGNLSSPVLGSINFGGSGTLTISGTSSDTQQSIQISNSLTLSISNFNLFLGRVMKLSICHHGRGSDVGDDIDSGTTNRVLLSLPSRPRLSAGEGAHDSGIGDCSCHNFLCFSTTVQFVDSNKGMTKYKCDTITLSYLVDTCIRISVISYFHPLNLLHF